jgi:putative DNA primase/helicase
MTLCERIERYVDAVPAAISGSHGHDQTIKLACQLIHGFDLSPGVAFQFLERFNQRCEPPWTARELQHKLASADAAEPGNGRPRGWLLEQRVLTKHPMS